MHFRLFSYSSFLVRFYWLVLFLTVVVVAACLSVAFTTVEFPDFADPIKVTSVVCHQETVKIEGHIFEWIECILAHRATSLECL